MKYDSFVEQRSNWGTNYKFNGKELDEETGFYYYGARYYNPDISIWLSIDPLSDKYPHQSNYMYCSGRPIVMIDPDGMREWPVNKTYNSYERRHENNWGASRGNNRLHKGVDINFNGGGNTDKGAPIFATHDGVISRLVSIDNDKSNAGGNRIQITSTCGKVSTFYMHLDSFAEGIVEGSYVSENDIIGFMGGSGYGKTDAFTSHLHYEMSIDGVNVNPVINSNKLLDAQKMIEPIYGGTFNEFVVNGEGQSMQKMTPIRANYISISDKITE